MKTEHTNLIFNNLSLESISWNGEFQHLPNLGGDVGHTLELGDRSWAAMGLRCWGLRQLHDQVLPHVEGEVILALRGRSLQAYRHQAQDHAQR